MVMMNLSQYSKPGTLADTQGVFTRHVRDPENQPAPGDIEDRRMGIYRNSIYLNIERMVSNFFPVLKKVFTEDDWHAMVRDYFRDHRSHVPPYLPRLGHEFLQYLENERDLDGDPPFILELAHYEWIEFALSIDTREIAWEGIDREGDLLDGVPVLNPLAMPLCYTYPVHTIGADNQPQDAPEQPTYLIVYRDRHYKTGFMNLNPVSARLVEKIMQEKHKTGRDLLEEIAEELNHPNADIVVTGGLDTMNQLHAKDILLGTLSAR